jgi:putative ABC transport system ATP-binding protein
MTTKTAIATTTTTATATTATTAAAATAATAATKTEASMGDVLVQCRGVTKVFDGQSAVAVHALRGIDLEVGAGEFLALVGPSGSGKTTLLNLVGALDAPTAGTLRVLDRDLTKASRAQRARLRLESIGFVFQAYNLVAVLTTLENVEFVLELQGVPAAERRPRARQVLEELGLGDLMHRRPKELSGGQQQRVAVARAVAARPRLVLADEPTANLDTENATLLMAMMRRLRDEHGMTFVFSTHDTLVMEHAARVVRLRDGHIVADERRNGGAAADAATPEAAALPHPGAAPGAPAPGGVARG